MPACAVRRNVRGVTDTDEEALRASAKGLGPPSGEDVAVGREAARYAEWILSSNAASAAFAPSPVAMTICFHGTVVTSPAA